MAARRDIHVFAGATETQTVVFPSTQAAYTFEAYLDDDTSTAFTCTQDGATVTAVLTDVQTATLTKPLYRWTLWRVSAVTEAILSGNVIVSR